VGEADDAGRALAYGDALADTVLLGEAGGALAGGAFRLLRGVVGVGAGVSGGDRVLGGFAADLVPAGDEILEVELVAVALVAVDGGGGLFGERAALRGGGCAGAAAGGCAGGSAGGGGGGGGGEGGADEWPVRGVGLVVLRGEVVGGVWHGQIQRAFIVELGEKRAAPSRAPPPAPRPRRRPRPAPAPRPSSPQPTRRPPGPASLVLAPRLLAVHPPRAQWRKSRCHQTQNLTENSSYPHSISDHRRAHMRSLSYAASTLLTAHAKVGLSLVF
jgi:hypothetical protein